MKNILDIARVVRSKNSGPYELVLDVMLKDRPTFDALRAVNDPDAISAWVLRIQELPAPASTALQPEKA